MEMSSLQQPFLPYQMADAIRVSNNDARTFERQENVAADTAAEEKRHRRRIRNRVSAARSRARKEAYVAALELEIERLKKENEVTRSAYKTILEMTNKRIEKFRRAGMMRGPVMHH